MVPNIPDEGLSRNEPDYSSFEDQFWQMMRALEERHCQREEVLNRDTVRAAYRSWNERFGTNMQPRFDEEKW